MEGIEAKLPTHKHVSYLRYEGISICNGNALMNLPISAIEFYSIYKAKDQNDAKKLCFNDLSYLVTYLFVKKHTHKHCICFPPYRKNKNTFLYR